MMKLTYKEERAKSLLARMEFLDAEMSRAINDEEWPNRAPLNRWTRAYDLREKCEKQLGRLARRWLREVA